MIPKSEASRRERASFFDTGLVLSMVLALGAVPLAPGRSTWLLLAVVLAVLTVVSVRRRFQPAMQLGLLGTLLLLTLAGFESLKLWPLPAMVAGACWGVSMLVAPLGRRPSWLRRGHLNATIAALIFAAVVVSAVALLVWFQVARPDYRSLRGTLLLEMPMPLLCLCVLSFAMINAAAEEFLYRGALMSALDETLGTGVASIVIQAAAFGLLHLDGFPRGPVGVALATIYGLMMGVVRRRADGMLAPCIAHVATDVAIGAILLNALH
ncbi:hypothetical protein AKJ09_07731 [Labilithrix luteola]|uniref:CAAX prenyl protease 2/Lysostaphin resistance protein A-like domain-containing protein n=1 Tax=Labilithrix luteola TaxID=1391654 RepID=A0A0K1Q5Q1_9BACT|nr:hypothetical protein AKJ09_07731 [Labilithrix luteola]